MTDDTLITLAVAAILIPSVVLPYLLHHRKKEREARERFERASISGLQAAVTVHPQINAITCIGCGGCVRVCPEGDVLGVIDGKAVLVHGSKCVGHALCAEACPVGAITMMMAAPGRNADLPVLDEHLETSVKNVFIVGELGGLGLIRNAILQGSRTVELIATRPRTKDGAYDVAIVGAGPAGLAAALAAQAQGLRYLLLEQGDVGGTILQYPRRKIVMTSPVVLPLWGKIKLKEASKETLLALWQQILTKTGVRVNANEKVTALRTEGDRQVLTTSLGEYRSAHVVLALGRRGTPRKLRVPGEDLPKVTYRLMDTESYQRCKVLIVGGGDSAVEAALGLALQGTNQITLSYRGEEFQRIKERNRQRLQDAVKRKSVTVLFRSQVTRIEPETVHLETAEGARVLQNDYVFIFAGGEMPFEFLRNIGIRFQETVIA